MRSLVAVLLLSLAATPVFGHCDAVDGPVIIEATQALASGQITPLLKWVKPDREAELRAAFGQTMKGTVTKDDFFATLVRLHREGEGAPFTGIKPAGQIPPPIAAADAALKSGSAEELEAMLLEEIRAGIRSRFAAAQEARKHSAETVDAGRAFVEAYVEYIHYAERLHEAAATRAAHGAEHEH
jgi:hypothetical protein